MIHQTAQESAGDRDLVCPGTTGGNDCVAQRSRVEIDNNLVENTIRLTALGKKNELFVGEAGAGQRGPILYSVIKDAVPANWIPSASP